MITLKIQNWKMIGSHNTHLMLLFRGNHMAKFYTHREYRSGGTLKGVDGSDTLRVIRNQGLCGLRLVLQIGRRRAGITFGGDSEYMRPPRANRKAFRTFTGY